MANFGEILDLVFRKSAFQKKRILKDLEKQDASFFTQAEAFAREYSAFLTSQNISLDSATDAYIEMCDDMLKSQLYFMKTDKYPAEGAESAYNEVYDNVTKMKSYMIGLAISQFLWPTHYKMYTFFAEQIEARRDKIASYLEIGPGHGLFLKTAYQKVAHRDKEVRFNAIDISKTSLDLSKSIVDFLIRDHEIEFSVVDALEYRKGESFDFVTMGEVLEHVEFPDVLLSKVSRLLAKDGSAFISTCVNCPSIDHVYHFKCVDEIRDILNRNNLVVKSELVLPVEDMPMADIIRRKITINYCAIVNRKN